MKNAAAATHYGDSADLRSANARAVTCIGACQIAATLMPGALQHQVHESAAPKTAAPRGVGPDIFARLGNQRIAGGTAVG